MRRADVCVNMLVPGAWRIRAQRPCETGGSAADGVGTNYVLLTRQHSHIAISAREPLLLTYMLHSEPAESWYDWFSHMFPIGLEYDRGRRVCKWKEPGWRKREQVGTQSCNKYTIYTGECMINWWVSAQCMTNLVVLQALITRKWSIGDFFDSQCSMVGMKRASMPVVAMSPSNLSSMHSLEAASYPRVRRACPSWVSCWVPSPFFFSSKPLVDAVGLIYATVCSLFVAHSVQVTLLSSPLVMAGNHSSSCRKGLAISSLPSTGEMTTSRVPRATMRPSLRYRMLPCSSAVVRYARVYMLISRVPVRASLTSSRTRFMSWS